MLALTSAIQPTNPAVTPTLGETVMVGSTPPRYRGSFRFSPMVLPGEVPREGREMGSGVKHSLYDTDI